MENKKTEGVHTSTSAHPNQYTVTPISGGRSGSHPHPREVKENAEKTGGVHLAYEAYESLFAAYEQLIDEIEELENKHSSGPGSHTRGHPLPTHHLKDH